MKGYTFIVCFILVLLFVFVAPVTAVGYDAISTISPSAGQTGDSVTVTITGQNFTNTKGSVRLEMSGESDIEASTPTTWTPTTIVCKFTIKSSKEPGKWDLVVVKGEDSSEIVKADGFAISEDMSITSITPTSGTMDSDVDFTIAGKGFDEETIDDVFLSFDDFDVNISASDYDVTSSTKITGTFDLGEADDDGKYDICIENDYGTVECKSNAFEVLSNAEGTIEIASSPSGATIYIDDITNGTTPRNVNILVGSHKVTLKKAGYSDWAKIVNVEEDETTEVDATLYAVATATPTTPPTAVPTTARTATPRTTVKSTIKIPTTYAEPVTTAAASPVDPALIVGTIGLAFIALRKH